MRKQSSSHSHPPVNKQELSKSASSASLKNKTKNSMSTKPNKKSSKASPASSAPRETRSSKVKLNSVNKKQKDIETSSHSDSHSEYAYDNDSFEDDDDDQEDDAASGKSFKRIKLHMPMYLSDENMTSAATIYNSNIHEDYDDEDDDEEMPKFQYESKFKGKVTGATPALYTSEERKILNDVLFNEFIDFDEPSTSPMDYHEPPMEPSLEFVSAEDLDTDIPLVTPLELSSQESAEKFASKFSNFMISKLSAETRWPITQQDNSTSFSILGKESSSTPVKTEKVSTETTQQFKQEEPIADDVDDLFEQESLNDFFMYDGASSGTSSVTEEDESDDNSLFSPAVDATTSSTGVSLEPLIWTSKKIPLCGYRDRNQTFNLPYSGTPLHPKRIMAALASLSHDTKRNSSDSSQNTNSSSSSSSSHLNHQKLPATAYFQQALAAAAGLNRRSLFSGKAREMIAMGEAWA